MHENEADSVIKREMMSGSNDEVISQLAVQYSIAPENVQSLLEGDCASRELDHDGVRKLTARVWCDVVVKRGLFAYATTLAFEGRLVSMQRLLVSQLNADDALPALFGKVFDGTENHPLFKLSDFATEARWWSYVYVSAQRLHFRELSKRSRNVAFLEADLPAPEPDRRAEEVRETAMNLLNDEEYELLELLLAGKQQREAAESLGCSESRISRMKQTIIAKLHDTLS